MNINPKELQKFHDLWAPMIAALPAVINAAERAAELENHLAIKLAEFEKLDQRCSKREADAETSVRAAQERTAAARASHAEAVAQMDLEVKEAKASVRKAKSDAAAKVAEHQATAAEAYKSLEQARRDHEEQLRGLKSERDILASGLNAEIKALEAKRDEVISAIETLRKQLG